jgi:hypothetical protein
MAGMKLTRRELAATLVSAAAAAAQAPETPDPKLRAATGDLARAEAALRRVKIGYEVEPAFTFRAQ